MDHKEWLDWLTAAHAKQARIERAGVEAGANRAVGGTSGRVRVVRGTQTLKVYGASDPKAITNAIHGGIARELDKVMSE